MKTKRGQKRRSDPDRWQEEVDAHDRGGIPGDDPIRRRLARGGYSGGSRDSARLTPAEGRVMKFRYNRTRWMRLRRTKLARDPLCEACLQQGKTTVAIRLIILSRSRRAVTHGLRITSVHVRLMSLAQDEITLTSSVMITSRSRDVDPATGRPLDSAHWWNLNDRKIAQG